jgi:hypothetical protein
MVEVAEICGAVVRAIDLENPIVFAPSRPFVEGICAGKAVFQIELRALVAQFIIVFVFRHRILVVQSHVEQGIVVGRFIVVVVVVVGIATTMSVWATAA